MSVSQSLRERDANASTSMPKIVLITALFYNIIVGPSAGEANRSTRIIGGHFTKHEYFPYLVSIQTIHHYWSHSCGGSILNKHIILTACHCLYRQRYPLRLKNPFYSRIVAGNARLDLNSESTQVAQAAAFYPHSDCGKANYNYYENYYHDNGLIVLKSPLRYTAEVQPLKVFSTNPQIASDELRRLQRIGTTCYIPGWGVISTKPNVGTVRLKVATKRLLTTSLCQRYLCRYGDLYCLDFDRFDQVCAIGSDSSVCYGDSGGPLVCNGFVFGTVSYGPFCGVLTPQIFSSIKPILFFYNKYASWRPRYQKTKRRPAKTISKNPISPTKG